MFDENQFNNNGTNSFSLSSLGEEVYLSSGDGPNLTGYQHGFQFGAQINGVTFGRYVTSDVPYVLVEEVHYSPLGPWPAASNGTGNSLQRRSFVCFYDYASYLMYSFVWDG